MKDSRARNRKFVIRYIDLQTLQVWENTFPDSVNYECVWKEKKKRGGGNEGRWKNWVTWNVPWSKTWVNLLVVELGQFDHSISFLRIRNLREYRFFQLETPFLETQKDQVGSVPMENTRWPRFSAFENDISDVVRVKKIRFFHIRKCFFPPRILLKIVVNKSWIQSNLHLCINWL